MGLIKKFQWIFNYLALWAVLIGIDFWSKSFSLNTAIKDYQFMRFAPVINDKVIFSGIVSKSFSVSFEIGLAFMIIASIAYIILRLRRSVGLKIFELSFLIYAAGITGNMLDRIWNKGVVDFINIKIFFLEKIAFNLADVFQVLALGLLSISAFIYRKQIWRDFCNRNTEWINSRFQISFILIILTMSWINTLILYLFISSYLYHQTGSLFIFWKLTVSIILLQLIWSILLLPLLINLSYRIVGPILAAKAFRQGLRGDKLKLREGDFFRDILKDD